MTEDLDQVDRLAANLLQQLDGPGRARLARKMANLLRRGQAARIRAQQNPDGSGFAPRKPREERMADRKRGTIRRNAMFMKIRGGRYLKAGASSDEVWAGFTGRVAAIAKAHQEGLSDYVGERGKPPRVRYAQRRLLGLSEPDRAALLDLMLEHVDG